MPFGVPMPGQTASFRNGGVRWGYQAVHNLPLGSPLEKGDEGHLPPFDLGRRGLVYLY